MNTDGVGGRKDEERIGVVGLGYVGLPLAAAFAVPYDVVGYDSDAGRVAELQGGHDARGETAPDDLQSPRLRFTADADDLRECTFIIVAVPTPLTAAREPDLTAVKEASRTIGRLLRRGMMVVYESTVYPGVTEEVCLPILEAESGLKLGEFDLGYSPERINPGDRRHTIRTVTKVVSGHDQAALERCARVYGRVVEAGVFRAEDIRTAEAAKVIENVQRDLNIALMNELSKIFMRMGLRTEAVLDAAATKWNFHRYYPGLVGGHCIGVDPYYLTYRALQLGYHPEVILAGRRINDSMGYYVGELTVRALNAAGRLPRDANVLVMGLTFKENVPDLRNTRAVDVVHYLQEFGVRVAVWEPLLPAEEISRRFGFETRPLNEAADLDAVVVINAHDVFRQIRIEDLRERMRTPVLVDVKNLFSREQARRLGIEYVGL